MKALRVHQYGGPEVLSYEEIAVPEPQAGEAHAPVEGVLMLLDQPFRAGTQEQVDAGQQCYEVVGLSKDRQPIRHDVQRHR